MLQRTTGTFLVSSELRGPAPLTASDPIMWQYALKLAITAAVVVAVSEIAKRSSLWGAALAALPLTSLLAFIWLYLDTRDVERVASLSQSIFWLVIPSLLLFLVLPWLLRLGWGFWASLGVACGVTAVAYLTSVWLVGRFGPQA